MRQRFPLIVIEGCDGSGKTTLRKGLFRLFEGRYDVTPLSILTTNFLDEKVAGDLVDGRYHPSADNEKRYLAALRADKQATINRLIRPALPQRPVIADRWIISELAFFAVKHGRSPEHTYAELAEAITITADLTLLLETTARTAVTRTAARARGATHPDWDNHAVQERVRAVHQQIATNISDYERLGPLARIDASADRATVLAAAWNALLDRRLT